MIEHNFVGTNGIDNIGNTTYGIRINGVASENTIRRNIVSGNGTFGIALTDGPTQNLVKENFVGTNTAGNAAIPNGGGVWIRQASDNTVESNLVSGNSLGILVGTNAGFGGTSGYAVPQSQPATASSGAVYTTGNRLFGNTIGLNAARNAAVPGSSIGIAIGENARNNLIGTPKGDFNFVSGNTATIGFGILLGTLGASPNEDALPQFNTFQRNLVGLGGDLQSTISNKVGFVLLQAARNTIGGETDALANIIVASTQEGVSLRDGTRENTFLRNFIGVLPAGFGSRVPRGGSYGNGSHGILVKNGASNNTFRNNAVSGNGANGITISGTSTSNNLFFGNLVGGAPGSRPMSRRAGRGATNGNAGHGIFIEDATNTRIGEAMAGMGNRIFENGLDGIHAREALMRIGFQLFVAGNDVSFNIGNGLTTIGAHESVHVLQGNRFTDNGAAGMVVASSNNNSITQNVVSNNDEEGVVLTAQVTARNDVRGNTISANGSHGVFITEGANTNSIGGPAQGQGNTINNNGGAGIHLTSTAGNGNNLDPNMIFGNVGPGIDIGGDGFTPNDPADADVGPNKLQNYPTMALSLVGGNLIVNYQVDSAPQHSTYGGPGIYVEFFEADATGAGRDFLGSDHYSLSDYNNGLPGTRVKNLGNAVALGITAGDLLTATATDAEGNSSEFAPTVIAPGGAPGFEGDVAPRPNGDGNMLSTDITQLRRFVSGLDIPGTTTNEIQRADCAPRSTFGDGLLTSTDVVQGRRYVAGLDPSTPSGGPASRSFISESSLTGDLSSFLFTREMRVGQSTTQPNHKVSVPIEMTSNGNETAMSLTIEYDANMLTNPRVSLGKFAPPGSTLTFNLNQPGRIGILIDSNRSMIASAMPVSIVSVTFDVIAKADQETAISLTDGLVARSVSDGYANLLPVTYRDGLVKIAARP